MIVRTTCNRDCPDACALLARVEDGRVTSLAGDPAHPVTRGLICHRTRRFPERQYHPSRLTRPLLRQGDRQVEIPWDEALDIAADRLLRIRAESGPAAIFAYRLGGSLGLLKEITDLFFSTFGPVTVKSGDVCSAAGEAAQMADFGVVDTHGVQDLVHARHIINWGRNFMVSSVHTLPIVQEARRRGASLLTIDPVFTATARISDIYLPVRPGGDLALAMAVGRRLFEDGHIVGQARCDHVDAFRALCLSRSWTELLDECDLSAGDVDAVVQALADGPTAILVGWGLQRRSRAVACVRLLDALGSLSGNLGRSGGGVWFSVTRRRPFDLGVFAQHPAPRLVREPLFGQDVLDARDPPIRAIWMSCANPVVTLPDSARVAEAIEGTEFTVVVDSHETDTTRRATLVLPTTTLLEDDDLLGSYGHHGCGVSRPVVPPPPGVLSDLEIVQAIAARVGLGHLFVGTARDWKARLLQGATPSLEELEAGFGAAPHPDVLFADGVPTSSGRVNLITEIPDSIATDPCFPLCLFSVSDRRSQASQWSPDPPDGLLQATMHPSASAGLPHGARARMMSPLGSMDVIVAHDPRQRPDVVVVPKGGPFDRGQAVNALIPARLTDGGEGAAYFDARVRVERLACPPTGGG